MEILGIRVEPVHTEPRAGDIRHSQADITRAREALGYEPRVTFREGLERTAASFRKESAGARAN
jgi:UDP-glucose 4-epimerase